MIKYKVDWPHRSNLAQRPYIIESCRVARRWIKYFLPESYLCDLVIIKQLVDNSSGPTVEIWYRNKKLRAHTVSKEFYRDTIHLRKTKIFGEIG